MSFVICRLPKAGLGNQLFPLMKAYVFAHINELPIIITNYRQLKIGVYLRGEKSKRNYRGYFNFEQNLLKDLDNYRKIKFSKAPIICEPFLSTLSVTATDRNYKLEAIPNWVNYFDQLKNYRQLVKILLTNLLRKEVTLELEKLVSPIIGVHVRMGDFRKLAKSEDFSKVGAVRTPEEYFVKIIKLIRLINGSHLPVSVFTDGFKHEFNELLSLDNITFIDGNKDIVDLLLLSRSKIIVTSAGSTFSYWAGFLSEVPIIMHPDHIHEPIRWTNELDAFEGVFDSSNPKLVDYIKQIK